MDTILLIVLAILIVFFSFIIIRSWLLQRQFKDSLHLNSTKNNNVLLKQASGLLVSLVMVVVVLNNSSIFIPKVSDAGAENVPNFDVIEAYKQYGDETHNQTDSLASDDIVVLGEITLEDNKLYVLVLIDKQYFLINEADNSFIEFKPAP